jgi:hypothetical protein
LLSVLENDDGNHYAGKNNPRLYGLMGGVTPTVAISLPSFLIIAGIMVSLLFL